MTALASQLYTPALTYIAVGRGENPGGVGGVLLVVGIALALILVAGTALYFVSRRFRARRERSRSAEAVEQQLPSEQGRPWSSER